METWSCSPQANCSATAAVCYGVGMRYHVVLHNSFVHAGHHDYHVHDYPHVTYPCENTSLMEERNAEWQGQESAWVPGLALSKDAAAVAEAAAPHEVLVPAA